MLPTAPIFKIFVSCPGDVTKEKEIIERVCRRLEDAKLYSGIDISIKVLYWKDIIGTYGDRPQTLINRVFENYQVYIGILWMRFGTATEDPTRGKIYESGTAEEFDLAVRKKEAGHGIDIAFFQKAALEDIPNQDQYEKVLTFMKQIKVNTWVNSFIDDVDFGLQVNQLLTQLLDKALLDQKEDEKKEIISVMEIEKPATAGSLMGIETLIKKTDHYILRTATQLDPDNFFALFSEQKKNPLEEIILKDNKIVVLGEPGSGKSTELDHLFYHVKDQPGSPLVPFFKKLGDFKDQEIEKFIQPEWEKIPRDLTLLILDGLDEVKPEYFKNAVQRINEFSVKYPEVSIVVSSRTNFYELPTKNTGGTLQGFKVFNINPFDKNDIFKFVKQKGIDAEAFWNDTNRYQYQDLVGKPFFLDVLTKVYKDKDSLKGGTKIIFDEAVRQRIIRRKPIKGKSLEILKTPEQRLEILSNIALAMESLERTSIKDSELKRLISDTQNYASLKDNTIFFKIGTNWSFEHNNFQEYLAASALSRLSIEQMKDLVSIRPNHRKIRPSWVNTLSFLISIIDNDSRDELIDWIIAIDPEVIVRFESTRIDKKIRFGIFRKIFDELQNKSQWIRSSLFSEQQLAAFADSSKSRKYLLEQLQEDRSNEHGQYNALILLYFFIIPKKEKNDFSKKIFEFIYRNYSNKELIYPAIMLIGNLSLEDQKKTRKLIAKLSDENSQYYRAALYTLINALGWHDEYIEIYLRGLELIDSPQIEGRSETSLYDESLSLRVGLESVTSLDSIKKIIQKIADPTQGYSRFGDGREIIEKNMEKARSLYRAKPDTAFMDEVKKAYIGYGRAVEPFFASMFLNFIKHFEKSEQLFSEILQNDDIAVHTKASLIGGMLNKDNAQQIQALVNEEKITTEELCGMFYSIRNNHYGTDLEGNENLISEIYAEVTGTPLEQQQSPLEMDRIRKERAENNFNMLFDVEEYLKEIKNIFTVLKKESFSKSDTNNFYSTFRIHETNIPKSAINALRDKAKYHPGEIVFSDIEFWASNEDYFRDYRVGEIYSILKGSNELTPGKQQVAFLEEWAVSRLSKIDFIKEENKVYFSYDEADDLYKIIYFVKKIGIELPENYWLELSKFTNENLNEISKLLPIIEGKTSKEKLEKQVGKNLKDFILENPAWATNARYAIDNQFEDNYPAILKELISNARSVESRIEVSQTYLEQTDGAADLYEVLGRLTKNDQLVWTISELLPRQEYRSKIITHLTNIMNDPEWRDENRFIAAQLLTGMEDKAGFDYYADALLNNKNPGQYIFKWLKVLGTLTRSDFIGKLEKLFRHTLKHDYKESDFFNVRQAALNGLGNIALLSQSNLVLVTNVLKRVINDFNPKQNYLYNSIVNLENQFFNSNYSAPTIKEIISDFKEWGLWPFAQNKDITYTENKNAPSRSPIQN